MLNFLLILLSPIIALGGVTNLLPKSNTNTAQTSYATTASCWNPEPGVTITVAASNLDSVHNQYLSQPPCHGPGTPFQAYRGADGLIGTYVRIRQNLALENLKVDQEGKPFTGGCGLTGSAIRWVGTVDNQKIYWEDLNHVGQKLLDFVFVEAYPADSKYHYFDIYARDSLVPDPAGAGYGWILDCKVSGGIVPVLENNADILPPQVVSFKEIDMTGFESNYCNFAVCPFITQIPGTIGPTLSPSYQMFPPYMNYLIKIDKEDIPAAAIPRGQIGKVTRTVKNVTHVYDVFYHAGAFYLRDQSDGTSYIYDPSEDAPAGSVSRNPSLQLGVLNFRLTQEFGPFTPVCKPAIYLYPTIPTNMSVKVVPDGYITVSKPEYNGGWNVMAYPDGTLRLPSGQTTGQSSYPYLYYEANIKNVPVSKEGWVVAKADLSSFFDKTLTQLGLNNRESNDFKAYWLEKLSDKPYYFVTMEDEKVINQNERLVFSQNPDTLIRMRFLFEGLDFPISVKPLTLPQTPKRNGFVVVDWGGAVLGGSCTSDGSYQNQIFE